MAAAFNLQESVLILQDPDDVISIESEVDVPNLSEKEVMAVLERAIDAVTDSPQAILYPEVFDIFQSLLKYQIQLTSIVRSKLLDIILSALQSEIEAATRSLASNDPSAHLEHKTPLEMYAFLLQWFMSGAEKAAGKEDENNTASGKKKRGGKVTSSGKKGEKWSWEAQLPNTLDFMRKALRMNTERIWTTTQERDAYINCFTRPVYHIAENEAYMKIPEIKMGMYKVICFSVKFHGHSFGAQTSIIQALQYFEHLSEPMAELLSILTKELDFTQLTEEVLRDISTKTFNAQDTKGPRSFSRFLLKIAELTPRVVMKQISLLLTHLNSESYSMRMAMVEVIGTLVRHLALSEEYEEANKKKQVDNFWAILTDRFLDVTSWVRMKVIQTVTKLMDMEVKFTKQRPILAELAIRHLEDKSASVRRYAIALLSKLIMTHPFGMLHGGDLNMQKWIERYESVVARLKVLEQRELENLPEGLEGIDEENGEEAEEPEEDENEKEDEKPIKSKKASLTSSAPAAPMTMAETAQLTQLRLMKKYHVDALKFIRQIELAMPKLKDLLVSTGRAEVLEAMDFFKLAHEYEFESASVGLKAMLHLIWTKDNSAVVEDGKELKGIRARVIECYKGLYFEASADPDMTAKQQISRIAKNMIQLTYGATLAEITSLEELMRNLMLEDAIHPDVIAKLWQVYNADQDIPRPQRRGAIIILGMLAIAKKEIIVDRVDVLLRIGLGPLGKADLTLARYTCVALQRISGSAKKIKGSLTDKSNRLPMENPIFQQLEELVKTPTDSVQWFGVAEQAINALYLLGEQPDVLAAEIIKSFTYRVFDAPVPSDILDSDAPDITREIGKLNLTESETSGSEDNSADVDLEAEIEVDAALPTSPSGDTVMSSSDNPKYLVNSFELGQLIFLVGHVALKHIVYLELVERELKRRKEQKATEAKTAGAPANKDPKNDNDLDQVSGNAEDDIGENMTFIREHEILYGEDSLLAVYGPLISDVCANPGRYRDSSLQTPAVLALSKLMCVSSQFCETQLPLLFRVFETTSDPIIRSNIVIALGDIAVCFSNMIDENSDRLYLGLSDENLTVKRHTLMVLTHLILNGMIKVKGQLGEMAKCIEDDDQRVRDLAKLFFKELSSKENALYNNLQDVISHLSLGKHAVDEETFEKTMKYIFTFIEKDKQAESIIEKLCQRFRLASDERQWRDIAFCLSLLPYKSERSVKKLIDGLPFYQDKLYEEKVFKRFTEILSKARANKQTNKPDAELNEFEAILGNHKKAGEEGQELDSEVAKKTIASAKRKTALAKKDKAGLALPSRKSNRSRKKATEDEDEEMSDVTQDEGEDEGPEAEENIEEEEEEEEEEPVPRSKGSKKPVPGRTPRKKQVVESEDEEEEEEEEEEVHRKKKQTAPVKASRKKRVVQSEEDEDEDDF
ncbi:mitotic chromosome condensation-related protein [Phaffia rhodozyma]|uniref:Condensin complex subunit 1 n=1 Tax=Phaffia rhodozyma TaxID=264483 RepID=A0A0F7SH20_PHARH|nr:mitotic chromosome condensation-related protein [Phaffia rhodozyma]